MVFAHEIEIVIPEDHQLTVEVPKSVRSGPARMILLVPSEEPRQTAAPEDLERWQALASNLAADARPFDELSLEKRRSRLRQVMGIGRGISASSEEFARRKSAEIELEDRKLAG